MGEIKLANNFKWYSNDRLGWIWCRTLIMMLAGLGIIYFVYGNIDEGPLFAVVGVPAILGVFNSYTFINNKKNSNDKKI